MSRIATTSIPYTEQTIANGNFDTTRATIDRVIIHTMVGTAESATARFNDPNSHVSAHYGVKLDGSLIHWLEETFTAYHAGNYPMNQRSIGIEHEDNGDFNGIRPDTLYTTSAKLVQDICLYYNIPIDRKHILKHSEVSDNPTGCPDALDIDRIVREASINDPLVCDPKSVRDVIVSKASNYDEFVKAGYNSVSDITTRLNALQQGIDSLNNQLGDAKKTNEGLTKEISDLTNQNATVTSELQKQIASDATAIDAGIEAGKQRDDLQGQLKAISQALESQQTLPEMLSAIQVLKKPHDDVVRNVVPLLEGLFNAAFTKKRIPDLSLWQKIISMFGGGKK